MKNLAKTTHLCSLVFCRHYDTCIIFTYLKSPRAFVIPKKGNKNKVYYHIKIPTTPLPRQQHTDIAETTMLKACLDIVI